MYMGISDVHGYIESEGDTARPIYDRPGNHSAIHYTLSNPIY